ncbi:MAG: hypothetical protein GY754_43415 [bacterium]|nr:hypothetical protein [bacterium]
MRTNILIQLAGFIIISALAFSGCEEGLTSNDSDENFSFSDIYTQMDSMRKELESLKQAIAEIPVCDDEPVTGEPADPGEVFAGVTRTGDTIIFSGVNVQIVNGTGSTGGEVNGLGNLVIGYNEARTHGNDRTGSHNLGVGQYNNFLSYGGIAAGYYNSISGWFSSVSGGSYNSASGNFSSVSGGSYNIANAHSSGVSGGMNNTASGMHSSVSGGSRNSAANLHSSVSGGSYNTAAGQSSSVSGGMENSVNGLSSAISGGRSNTVDSDYSVAP